MKNSRTKSLFEALAYLSVPLERTFHIALVEIKKDETISERKKETLLSCVKNLLSSSSDLHEYTATKSEQFNICKEGLSEYEKIRINFKNAFPSEHDEEINLHLAIDEETTRRVKEKNKKRS